MQIIKRPYVSRWIVPLLVFLYCIAINFLSLDPNSQPRMDGDSPTYLGWLKEIIHLRLPFLDHRTPIYPLVLAFMEFLGSWQWVVYFQSIAGALAGLALWQIANSIFKNYGLSSLAVVFCLSDYGITNWHGMILTESLSMSFLLIWISIQLATIEAIEVPLIQKRIKYFALSFDCILAFLRPTFLALAMGWYCVLFFFRKISFQEFLKRSAFVSIFILIYCISNFAQTGNFRISNVGAYNKLGNSMRLGLMAKASCENQRCSPITLRAIEIFSNNEYDLDPWIFKKRLIKAFPELEWEAAMNTLNTETLRWHGLEYVFKALKRYSFIFKEWWLYSSEGFLYAKSKHYRALTEYYKNFYKNWAGTILFLSLVLFVYKAIFERKVAWITLIFLYSIFYTATVSVLGTYDEWFRMLAPIRPLVYAVFVFSIHSLFAR